MGRNNQNSKWATHQQLSTPIVETAKEPVIENVVIVTTEEVAKPIAEEPKADLKPITKKGKVQE